MTGADAPATSLAALRNGRPPERSIVHRPLNTRRATIQFAAVGLMTLAVIAVLGAWAAQAAASKEAISDARRSTATLAAAVIEPNLTDALLAGQPAAAQHMNTAVVGHVTRGPLVRIKIWTAAGRIVYSDQPQLIGAVYHLSGPAVGALRGGRSSAGVSDLSEPENRFERGQGKLLEVYQPVRAISGQKLLFETYFSYGTVTQREHQIWAEFVPITFGALVSLQLVQIPLARRMARRLDTSQRERERLMRDALAASDATRRRIARDVHDGVVQDLIAVSYTLTGSAARTSSAADSGVLQTAAETVRRGIGALRSLLVEIYPPSLHTAGLPAALADLVSSVSGRGVDITFAIPDEVSASAEAEELVFRTAQEALRNVLAHANAQHADLALQQRDGQLVLTVSDDGIGFDPAAAGDQATQGHLGLRLLRDLATEADASLEIHTAPGCGTRVQLEAPVT